MARKMKRNKNHDLTDVFGEDFNDESYLLDEYEEDFDYMTLIGKKSRSRYNENEY